MIQYIWFNSYSRSEETEGGPMRRLFGSLSVRNIVKMSVQLEFWKILNQRLTCHRAELVGRPKAATQRAKHCNNYRELFLSRS